MSDFGLFALALLIFGGKNDQGLPSGSDAAAPWTDDEMKNFALAMRSVGADPAMALYVYNAESQLDPHAVNASSGAQGLAQVMPSTLKGLGYQGDPSTFAQLSLMDQLPVIGVLVASQFQQLGYVPTTPEKWMHLQLAPATAKTSHVFSHDTDEAAYSANAQLDANGKGYVDESDLAAWMQRQVGAPYRAALAQYQRLGV